MSEPVRAPILPPELEQAIFEVAAYEEPPCVPRLMLVAWRVKKWVERYLYRILLFSDVPSPGLHGVYAYPYDASEDEDEILLHTHITSLPIDLLKSSVQHLCVRDYSELTQFLLSTCSSVEDFWGSPLGEHERLGSLPLKRLHCSLFDVFEPTPVDFSHALFSHVTHLEIFDRSMTVDLPSWSGLASIPHLTHLALDEVDFLSIVSELLGMCASLRVLIILVPASSTIPDVSLDFRRDPRLVVMQCSEYIKDWHMGALTGVDFWSRAEDFVEKRRAGEVDRLQCVIEVDASTLLP
ncbi:hypothetical protein FB45DRAFT_933585 [Roridomyces roridus]|uniref:Uncharacterized protein n=1 Tax=Roridomyces roridus TaxID=1738132 RepID=A0AAD7BCG7_9AGAR|nr:hypothetical protein FB45DRAFT_933585 [Roridomyces roridus]